MRDIRSTMGNGDLTAKALLVLAGVIYGIICFYNHYLFRTFCFDYGVYNFAFRDYAHFRISACTLYPQPHINFLQDHISFTFWIFIPLYWLLGWIFGTYSLMVIQTALILTGGWFVYRLVELKTGQTRMALPALLLYLFFYGRWTSFDADCNLAIMASSMIPVFLYYFEQKRFLPMYLVLAFILLTREDMPLWTLFIALYMLITGFRDKAVRNNSLIVMAASSIYFMLIFKWIIPLTENSFKQYSLFNYTSLGSNPSEALTFIFTHPFKTLALFFENTSGNPVFDYTKLEFYLVYLIAGGYLLFFRPLYLLWFLPILARKMLNDEPLRWSSETYYSIEFVSLLPVAVFCIIGNFRSPSLRTWMLWLVLAGSLGITVYKSLPGEHKSPFWYDKKHGFYNSSFYKAGFNAGKIHRNLNQIPGNVAVSASGSLATQLAWRDTIYHFPRVEHARTIAVFSDRDTYPYNQTDFDSLLYTFRFNGNWTTIADEYPLLILEKSGTPASGNLRTGMDTTLYFCNAEKPAPDGKSLLADGNLVFGNADALSREASKSGTNSIKLDESAQFGFTTVVPEVKAGERFVITVWQREGNASGRIIATATGPSAYYNADQEVVMKAEGWELIRKDVRITQTWPGQELKIYVWNNTQEPAFFDDLRIMRISPR